MYIFQRSNGKDQFVDFFGSSIEAIEAADMEWYHLTDNERNNQTCFSVVFANITDKDDWNGWYDYEIMSYEKIGNKIIKRTNINVKKYEDGDWRMDFLIMPDGSTEAWIYRDSIGVKSFVYGLAKETPFDVAEQIAVRDFVNEEHRDFYDEQYN